MDRTSPSVAGELRQPRWVLHVDMDAFFASCEQLARPTLRGRPVLVGGLGGRGVVAGASYEARALGAHSAQPIGQARRAVGQSAVVLPPRRAVYSEASRRVFAVIRRFFPVLEQLSIDEGYGEPPALAGASVAEVREFCEELRAAVREETGLPASVGAGAGKQYAKIASDLAKPDGIYIVPAALHEEIIYPLPVRKLWGIGPVAAQKLSLYGVETIGDLAALRPADAVGALGTALGTSMLAMAQGIDDRGVHEPDVAKQISSEFTVAEDLRSPEEISAALAKAARSSHRRLLADGRLARTVTVKLKLADFQIISRSSTLRAATTDLDVILEVARALAPNPREVGAVRLVGVSLSSLTAVDQPSLFDDDPAADRERHSAGPVGDHADSWLEPGAESGAESDQSLVQGSERSSDYNSDKISEQSSDPAWGPGDDVRHNEFGFGWVQGAGHGWVSVRFETRATGAGKARSLRASDPELQRADPVDSLAWEPMAGGVEDPLG
ncbi:DNA polymerase IV [Dietzia sp.]|uniref:DNA polymerase IV n=1 Tax=Dietzia sp. TaxID=1871616 RepID=UPI002FDB3A49